ncbi:hypothetical protein JCM10213v2_008937 [Rhodosporidiobolus nylandii]
MNDADANSARCSAWGIPSRGESPLPSPFLLSPFTDHAHLRHPQHLNSTSFPAIAVVSLDVQMAPTSPGTKCSRASASDLAFKLYSPCQDDPIDCPTSLDKMEACLSGSAGDVHGVSSDFCKKVKPTSPLFSVKSVRSLTAVAFRRVGSTRALHQLYSQGLYAWLAVRWEGGSGNGWVVRDMHASARVNDALSLPM